MCSSHRLGFGATDAPIGHIPSTIVSSDFNGDGIPDVATLNADETVSVILGLGDGTFAPAQDYVLASASAGSSQLMVAADLNGDGYPDLAVVETGGKVQILAGSASGALTAEPVLALTGTTTSLGLVTADFDGDGKPDLAIFGDPSGRVAVLTNTGALAFTESDPQLFSSAPVALAAADMDGDGRPDLLGALAGTSTLVISLSKSGGFTQAPLVTLPNVATSLAVADVDGDKKNDVVAGFIDGSVQVMIGNGAGGLGAVQKIGAAGTTSVAPVALADVTGDGLVDIVALSPSQLTLFPSATLGTWSAPVGFSVAGATGLASVDVNKDGAADVLVDGFGLAGSVSVLLAAPRTYLAAATLVDTSSGNFSAPLVVDVNGDGHLDAVATSTTTTEVGVFLNNGDGTFAPVVTYGLGAGACAGSAAVGDVNGDGRPDIVVADPCIYNSMGGHGAISVLVGTANGFAPVRQYATPIAYESQGFSVLIGDFNNDGKQDLLAYTAGFSGSVTPASALIFLGTGGGSLGSPTVVDVSFPAQVGQLFAAKLNGDQTLDLVGLGSYNTGGNNPTFYTTIFTRLGNGDGTFGGGVDRIVTATGYDFETASIALGDFNKDGNIDVMSYRALDSQGTFELWTGDGSGTLNAGPSLQDPFSMTAASEIAAGDFDGDGNTDVAVHEEFGIGILSGSPSGALNAAFYRSTGNPSGIATGDLAGSGLSSVFYTAFPGAGAMLNLCK